MRLRHFTNIYSDYDFVDVQNEGESIETWTYLLYVDEEGNEAVEIEFEIHYAPEQKIELVRATNVLYGEFIVPCSICGTMEMDICPEFEAEKDPYDTEYAFLHECDLTEEEVLSVVTEIYLDDNFDGILHSDSFDEMFIIERKEKNLVQLYEDSSANRYLIKGNNVFHLYQDGIEPDVCPFCEGLTFKVYEGNQCLQKCSVLTKNIRKMKKLIKNSKQEPLVIL